MRDETSVHGSYRVERATIVLAEEDGHSAAVRLSEGAILATAGPGGDERFEAVETGGKRYLMFRSDLQTRCRPVTEGQ
jgi:hypothetical protein